MKYLLSIFALLIISYGSFCQNHDFAKLDRYFASFDENNRFHGSVSVTKGGKQLYSRAIGFADMEAAIRNNIDTKFRIGSISKTFTATLIMQAVEQGKIGLDETIDSYFPRIQNAKKITVRQLLNHRSGITSFTDRNYFSWHTKPLKKAALLDSIVHKGVDFEPNTDYAYSNSNYVLLSFILESIFENSYDQIIDQQIVRPLKLSNTGYGSAINTAKNEAKSYTKDKTWKAAQQGDMSIPLGAGGIVSTPGELCMFMEALFNGQLIKPKTFDQMKPVGNDSYGFALYEIPYSEGISGWGHGGNIDAFASNLVYFEDENICIAVSTNGAEYDSHNVGVAVMSELFDQPYEIPSFDFVKLASEELNQYLGTYETPDLPMDMTISKKADTLLLQLPGQSPGVLWANGNHEFSIMKYGVKIKFEPENGKMHFEQQGMKFELSLKAVDETETSEDAADLNNSDLDRYIGTYSSDALPIDLTVSRKDDQLMGQGDGQQPFSLTSAGKHSYKNKEIGLSITFIPEEKKLNFIQGGATFEMTLKE